MIWTLSNTTSDEKADGKKNTYFSFFEGHSIRVHDRTCLSRVGFLRIKKDIMRSASRTLCCTPHQTDGSSIRTNPNITWHCVYMYLHTLHYISLHVDLHVHIQTQSYKHTNNQIYKHTNIHTLHYIALHYITLHTYIYTSIRIHIYLYIHLYVYMVQACNPHPPTPVMVIRPPCGNGGVSCWYVCMHTCVHASM